MTLETVWEPGARISTADLAQFPPVEAADLEETLIVCPICGHMHNPGKEGVCVICSDMIAYFIYGAGGL